MKPDRGDVVLVLFPDSNLQTAKRRPALVVQADNLGTGLPQVIVALITSNMARAGHPSRVAVRLQTPAGRASGLRGDSVIKTNNLATNLGIELDCVIGRLTDMSTVNAALQHTFGL
jgi:mRNA interferase MazF